MHSAVHRLTSYIATHHHRRVVMFVFAGVCIGMIAMVLVLRSVAPAETGQVAIPQTEPDPQIIEPVLLSIPKLDLKASFEAPLGVNENREIEVPDGFDTVGWYKYGPVPGTLGPAVVLGHVDSKDGPAVFWSLGELEVGDEITITDAASTTRTFTVTRLERHEQAGFPTEQVYGDIDHAGLRLITCSGTYDRETQRYSHNLIVFARLAE